MTYFARMSKNVSFTTQNREICSAKVTNHECQHNDNKPSQGAISAHIRDIKPLKRSDMTHYKELRKDRNVMLLLNSENVREIFDCDPERGLLVWRSRDIKWFNDTKKRTAENTAKIWNTRYAGKNCFYSPNEDGYHRVGIFRKKLLVHRIIWLWVNGEWPKVIDHIDGNPSNNAISNLRDVSFCENSRNARKNSANSSGYRGVCWDKNRNKWMANIRINGRSQYLGRFDTPEEAFEVYCKFAKTKGFTERHIFGEKQ